MIVDRIQFESLSRMSNKRVLCRCDTCKEEHLIRKAEITNRGGNYVSCKSCSTTQRLKGKPPTRKNFRQYFRYTKNEDFFSVPNLTNSYWAGFIAADGHLTSKGATLQINIQARDRSQNLTLLPHSWPAWTPLVSRSNCYCHATRWRTVQYE